MTIGPTAGRTMMRCDPSEILERTVLSELDAAEASMDKDDDLVRVFPSGATRSADEGKLDFDGFLSPLVLNRYAEYLHKHRRLPDGTYRDSDNWKAGIPLEEYMKSAWRHFMKWWSMHWSGPGTPEDHEEALCAVIFNASGYLHEILKGDKG